MTGDEVLAALADPTRRALLAFVAASPEAVGRDEAAAAAGIGRSLAGYHLDELVAQGLLVAAFERRNGRTGPGAGRPAKVYRRAATEVTVQVPPRDDAFLADLLAGAVEADAGGGARREAMRLAHAAGAAAGRDAGDGLRALLAERGYTPAEVAGELCLRNCPFGHVAPAHVELVCGLNLAFLSAAAEAAGAGTEAVLSPAADRCCVVFRPPPG